MEKLKWFKLIGENSPSPYEANAACGTAENPAEINPLDRTGFETEEAAHESLRAWLAKNPTEDKNSFVLIKTFH
jgi:hypothetical protein